MLTCPQCGIEREPEYSECPLCESSYLDEPAERPARQLSYPGTGKPLTGKEKKNLFLELSGILHLSSMIVLFLIDLILNKKPSWSWYTCVGITSSFLYNTLAVFTFRKPFIFFFGVILNTLLLLFTIDILDGELKWFLVPALPLTAFLFLCVGLVLLFIKKTKNKGLNIIAAVALAIGVYIVFTDLCISWVYHQHLALSWSVVVAASILPFALLLLYFHYRLKRGTSLRKFFNL